jgi:riboflavin kinase/FMN adenylyltransferase
MKILKDFFEGYPENTSLALGTFDGVHLGHRAVIKSAADSEFASGVVCFTAPPSGSKKLLCDDVKQRFIAESNVDILVLMNFLQIKDLSPEEFVDILAEKYNAKRLSCGYNFRFGKGGAADAETLSALGKQRGIEVIVTNEVRCEGEPVSSTKIRELLSTGDVKSANKLLGREYMFSGEVIHGAARGRNLGSPTINQLWDTSLVLPRFGVYAASVEIDGAVYKAVTNIGCHPTFGKEKPTAESYILDYKGNLYGKNLFVSLHDFIRSEQKFKDQKALCEQIAKDTEFVKNLNFKFL